MPFKNSVIAAIIATALNGPRIVIDGTGTSQFIRFYTGDPSEAGPAEIVLYRVQLPSPRSGIRLHSTNVVASPSKSAGIVLETDEATAATAIVTTSDFLQIGPGAPLGGTADLIPFSQPWTAWTPDIRQGGGAIAIANNDSWYMTIGKTVWAILSCWMNGAGGAGNPVTFSLPLTAKAPISPTLTYNPIGHGMYYVNAAGSRRSVMMQYGQPGTFSTRATAEDFTANQQLGIGFAVGVNDQLRLTLCYERS